MENLSKQLVGSIQGRGHVVVMDNFFTSIELFEELAKYGTYAIGTIRLNRTSLPSRVKDKKLTSKLFQGILLWKMNSSRKMCAITWINK